MPTERFYRLPEGKKQVIREAAIKEFVRVPFDRASINQIIRNADISRGSFYTYFVDKHDVVEFLLEDQFQQMKKFCEEELRENHGDYFAMVEHLFDFFVETLQKNPDMVQLARNLFADRENNELVGMKAWPKLACLEMQEGGPSQWMDQKIDKSCYRPEIAKDFSPLMILAMSSLTIALKQFYEYPEYLDSIRKRFLKSLDILRRGSYAEREPDIGEG
ncbi:TetR/AcrR family transcriptional regulator [Candidatus Ventrimonas sp. KK005]|jgi:Transcriptional regulator